MSLVTLQNKYFKISWGSNQAEHAGVHIVKYHVDLEDYLDVPAILDESAKFVVTLFHQTTDLTVPDQIYSLNTGPLLIQLPVPTFTPDLQQAVEFDESDIIVCEIWL